MKKKHIILFLGLIISCSSKENLEGTWIGAYSHSTTSDSNKMPKRVVITFEKDKYLVRSFKYDYRSESDFEKGTYEFDSDTIFFNSDKTSTAIVNITTNDSLVMKGLEGANNTVYMDLDIPYIITQERNGLIKLTGLHQRKYEIELKELE